jgi:putative DNA modification/repair radical SAM protein
MELIDKLKVLASSAKYDASCSTSGSSRKNNNGLGNAAVAGICHSWSSDGRCVSLLKVLYSNFCIYDCAYCINRKSNDIPRATFEEKELINLTINFYKRNYIEGLFLSSAVFISPNHTMEKMFNVVKSLRENYNFNGYIHLKAIPGADNEIIRKAGFYVDRMSVNLELPSIKSLKLLAPEKSKENLLSPMKYIGTNILQISDDKKNKIKHTPEFVPAGQSTQMIVGASPENDYTILNLSEKLYKSFGLKRVYYSAYIPTVEDNRLPRLKNPPLVRENRLYQADWLLRFYNFKAEEILDERYPFLDETLDPKTSWAIRNFHFFPVEANKADLDTLLRVPGIGVKSALEILKIRKQVKINFTILKKIGIVLKRARFFLICDGKYYRSFLNDSESVKFTMLTEKDKNFFKIPLFDNEFLPMVY